MLSDIAIKRFLSSYRDVGGSRITPKLHLLEDHIIPFIQMWGKGMETFGEQGGEKLHRIFNNIERNTNCRKGSEESKVVASLKAHIHHIAPEYFF